MTNEPKRLVYLDNAATTPVYPEVFEAMVPYFTEKFGNPSSVHQWGQEARIAIDESRVKIANVLGCSPEEIIFTPSPTASDNLAIQGVALAQKGKVNHIITSAIEHHAVLDTVKALEKEDLKITILPVDKYGIIDSEALEKAITPETIIVSIMAANNEVGTVEPLAKVREIIDIKSKQFNHQIYFHTDAAAAFGWMGTKIGDFGNPDLLTLGAHKLGGPKGIAILYIREGTKIRPITFGGHHENGLWPGTEPTALIVGTAKAMEITELKIQSEKLKISELRDRLIQGMLKIPGIELTGHPEKRLADIASFAVHGVEGEAMLLLLSDEGIAASSGSACTSGELSPSHVLLAMGIPPEKAHGSIRFSLSPETTEEDIDYVLEVFPGIVEKLRRMRKGIH